MEFALNEFAPFEKTVKWWNVTGTLLDVDRETSQCVRLRTITAEAECRSFFEEQNLSTLKCQDDNVAFEIISPCQNSNSSIDVK